jgi:hypothetical protein
MTAAAAPTIIEHLERFLGEIEVGWSRNADGEKMPFQVVRFDHGDRPDTVAFSTLGLSRHALHNWSTGQEVRQELMVIVPRSMSDAPVPALLQQVGEEALSDHHAYLRGQVIGPRGQLFNTAMEALLVSAPVYLPDEFATCSDEIGNLVVIAWLVPISRQEAEYVGHTGLREFEDRLLEAQPDLTDPFRASLPV